MITCRDLILLLLDFVSGELPPEHRALVEHHLRFCPPCVHYLETYQITIKLARQLPCDPLPHELAQRLRAALEQINQEQPSEKKAGGEKP